MEQNIIKKIESCLYCGTVMESITAKKRFCTATCRVYLNRRKKTNENRLAKIVSDTPEFEKTKEKVFPDIVVMGEAKVMDWQEKQETKKDIPPMPTRNPGEDAIDFAIRKNEWKEKYIQ